MGGGGTMFEKKAIGKSDIFNELIHEGDKIRFKSHLCDDRYIKGTVRHKREDCAFVLEVRDDGYFFFHTDVYDLLILHEKKVK